MVSFEKLFSFQVFFIFLRETFEISIIVAILLSIVKQTIYPPDQAEFDTGTASDNQKTQISETYDETIDRFIASSSEEEEVVAITSEQKKQLYTTLKTKVIFGSLSGVFACFIIGIVIISIFYTLGHDLWQQNEHIFEAVMSIFASIIISSMSIIFLRIGKLQDKIRMKMTKAIYNLSINNIRKIQSDPLNDSNNKKMSFKQRLLRLTEKEAIFFLPFITALREGLEAVVFLGGVGIDSPLSSLPLSMILAASVSIAIGRFFYKSSTSFSLRICLVTASCLLYILASGLMSKGVWQFDVQKYVNNCDGQDMTELGNGPGSYDIEDSVWHVNWGGEKDGFWVILTAIFGWTNSATYNSVISYNVYWLHIIMIFKLISLTDKLGYIPLLPFSWQKKRIQKRIDILKHKLKLDEISDESQTNPLLSK
ncbi:hypothetical protein QEN19_001492 [Hanseniaspora menglaensis]